jgi:membrane fusion protein, multidrug efflux system
VAERARIVDHEPERNEVLAPEREEWKVRGEPEAEPEHAPHRPEDEPNRVERTRGFLSRHKGLVLLFLAVVAVAGYFVWQYYSVRESTDDAQIDAHIVPVGARVGGTVTQVMVNDNEYVEAGKVLVQLDPTDYQVALAKARADLADAEAGARAAQTGVPIANASTRSQLAGAEATLNASQRQVEAANAQLRQAQANWTKANADLQRMKALVQKDEISRQQYDAAVAAEEATRAGVETARAQVAAAEGHVAEAQAGVAGARTGPQQVQVTEARTGSAQASVERYRAAVKQAELNLEYATIKAPQAGIVSKRNVEVGQVIQPGQPVVALVALDDIWVTANFKETQLKKMRVGDEAKIHVDAYDRDFKAHVDSIGGATGARFSLLPPENATGNYVKVVQRVPVKLVFEPGQDPQHQLRPGMSAEPTVMLKH